MGDTAADASRSVRIEFEADTVSPTVDPSMPPPNDRTPRASMILLGLIVLALGALGIFALRPEPGRSAADQPIVASTTTAPEVTTSGPEGAAATAPPTTETDPRRGRIVTTAPFQNIVEVESGWYGLRGFDRPRLVFSPDAENWDEYEGDLPTGTLQAITQVDGDLFVVASSIDQQTSTIRLDTYVLRNPGEWVLSSRHRPITGIEGRPAALIAGDALVSFSSTRWSEPVPVVSDLLAEFVDRTVADVVCEIDQDITTNGPVYVLLDCTGERVGVIDDVVDVDDARISFAEEILRSHLELIVSVPGSEQERLPLEPGQFPLGVAATPTGFVAQLLEPIETIEDPTTLFATLLPTTFVVWSGNGGLETPELPVDGQAWIGNQLHSRSDGSVILATNDGVFRSSSPFDDWELLLEHPDQSNAGVVSSDRAGTSLWYQRFDGALTGVQIAPDGEPWRLVSVDPSLGGIVDVLLVRDDMVVLSVAGDPMSVPLPPAAEDAS
ncbi:MAG: hypothetical protein ACR2P0_04480 [Acidimicrobiales bacterium]